MPRPRARTHSQLPVGSELSPAQTEMAGTVPAGRGITIAGPSTQRDVVDYSPIHDYHSHDPAMVVSCELCVLEDHRIFYICHTTRSSHWEPPWASWRCRMGLPYGWEQAVDSHGHHYYIDHVHRVTSYSDPRQSSAPEGKRTVRIPRKEGIGFGFVAAGQQPTIIQFVSPEGPSDGLLYANDQILSVDGKDVSHLSKDDVVDRVRAAAEFVEMIVEQMQPRTSRSSRRHYKVRFTDRVAVASRPESPSDFPPPLPNVLRVFLENGQTRSFKYSTDTTVKDILTSLLSKLQIKSCQYFALAVEYSLGARSSRISLLRQETLVAQLVSLPNSSHLRCVLRFSFAPRDVTEVLPEDSNAFEYFYQQSVNDVVRGRFAYEMRYEACMRLAALQMQQISLDSTILKDGRVSVSKLEKEYGLDTFLPSILLDNVKRREIRKHLRFYLKKDNCGIAELHNDSKGKNIEAESVCTEKEIGLIIRMKYTHIVSHLPSFGGRGFSVTFKESHIDMIMQIDPKNGLLVRHPGNSGQPAISIGLDLIGKLVVREESDVASLISIRLANTPNQGLEFIVERDDVDDLLSYLAGYHQVQLKRPLLCEIDDRPPTPLAPPTTPPPYSSHHTVISSGWNYSNECTSHQKQFDLTSSPPAYVVANSFAQLEIIPNGISERRNSDSRKPLLKATDSLLIKNSKQLQMKESASPLLKRPSNPSGRKMEPVSDSSDTEDSSWSSPLRSPNHSARSNGMGSLLESNELLAPELSTRRESIETLMQGHQNSTLESLILHFPSSQSSISPLGTPVQEQIPAQNGNAKKGKRTSLTFSEATTGSPLDDVQMIDGEPQHL